MTTSSRRDFVTGRALAAGLHDRLAPAPRQNLLHYTRRAMGCGFSLFLPVSEAIDPTVALEMFDIIERIEANLSVYRSDSEVSRINRLAAKQRVVVSEPTMALLVDCLQLWQQTHGAFDVTAGRLTHVWGFIERRPRIPSDADIALLLPTIGCDKLLLNTEARTIHFVTDGPELNFGGIGKGFALDACRDWLLGVGVQHFMLHGGLSSIVAAGSSQPLDPMRPWLVDLRLPQRASEPNVLVARLPVHDAAMATSGDAAQYFEANGQRYGHILDPRSGRPADGVITSTVFAPNATQADALSTAFFILGVEDAATCCQSMPEIGALLVHQNDSPQPIVHAMGRLPSGIQWGDVTVKRHPVEHH